MKAWYNNYSLQNNNQRRNYEFIKIFIVALVYILLSVSQNKAISEQIVASAQHDPWLKKTARNYGLVIKKCTFFSATVSGFQLVLK